MDERDGPRSPASLAAVDEIQESIIAEKCDINMKLNPLPGISHVYCKCLYVS